MKSAILVPFLLALASIVNSQAVLEISTCPQEQPGIDVTFSLNERVAAVQTGSLKAAEVESATVSEDSDDESTKNNKVNCNSDFNDKFRQIDGTCNHRHNLGAANKPFYTLIKPEYGDDWGSPRTLGVDGNPLPSALNVSRTVHFEKSVSAEYPLMVLVWGQWLDHVLTGTAAPATRPACCGTNGSLPGVVRDESCFPVPVPANDTQFPGTCFSFIRSMGAENRGRCKKNYRRQINTVTPFIDASQVYGSSLEVAAKVRVPGDSCLLQVKTTVNGSFLPENPQGNCNKRPGSADYCPQAGDNRGNQHPCLSVLNTVWVRYHNRLCDSFTRFAPTVSKELIFQIIRAIVIALHQQISYNEYLPAILGPEAKLCGLTLDNPTCYSPDVNPEIFTEFSTAAFRAFHSNIPDRFAIGDLFFFLSDHFNSYGLVLDDASGLVSGMSGVKRSPDSKIQATDRYMAKSVSRELFKNKATGKGLDLTVFDIQRGRDHGVPRFNKLRVYCNLPKVTRFNSSALGNCGPDLSKVYSSPEDIDAFTGGLCEPPLPGGQVGPTFSCLLKIQFSNLKRGDRLFHNNRERGAYNDAQIKALRKIKMSTIFCQTTSILKIQKEVFKLPDLASNVVQSCDVLKQDDLNPADFLP